MPLRLGIVKWSKLHNGGDLWSFCRLPASNYIIRSLWLPSSPFLRIVSLFRRGSPMALKLSLLINHIGTTTSSRLARSHGRATLPVCLTTTNYGLSCLQLVLVICNELLNYNLLFCMLKLFIFTSKPSLRSLFQSSYRGHCKKAIYLSRKS